MSARKPQRNGKPESTTAAMPSPPSDRVSRLKNLLAEIYAEKQQQTDPEFDAQCKRDFVFHMTDWLADFESLDKLYRHPDQFSVKQAEEIVTAFLLHAVWHIRAAGRLLLDWQPEDIFLKMEKSVRKQPTKPRPAKAAKKA